MPTYTGRWAGAGAGAGAEGGKMWVKVIVVGGNAWYFNHSGEKFGLHSIEKDDYLVYPADSSARLRIPRRHGELVGSEHDLRTWISNEWTRPHAVVFGEYLESRGWVRKTDAQDHSWVYHSLDNRCQVVVPRSPRALPYSTYTAMELATTHMGMDMNDLFEEIMIRTQDKVSSDISQWTHHHVNALCEFLEDRRWRYVTTTTQGFKLYVTTTTHEQMTVYVPTISQLDFVEAMKKVVGLIASAMEIGNHHIYTAIEKMAVAAAARSTPAADADAEKRIKTLEQKLDSATNSYDAIAAHNSEMLETLRSERVARDAAALEGLGHVQTARCKAMALADEATKVGAARDEAREEVERLQALLGSTKKQGSAFDSDIVAGGLIGMALMFLSFWCFQHDVDHRLVEQTKERMVQARESCRDRDHNLDTELADGGYTTNWDDKWGQPICIYDRKTQGLLLLSAGPDEIFHTSDDIRLED